MSSILSVHLLQPELRLRLFRKFEYVPVSELTKEQYETCLQLEKEGLLCLESLEHRGPCFYFCMPAFQHAMERRA